MEREELDQRLWELRTPMLRLAVSILRSAEKAEDAVSSAVITAYRKCGTLRDDTAFKPWMLRITANCCYDVLRREKHERRLMEEAAQGLTLFEPPEEETLLSLIERLPRALAQTLVLYYYENLSTQEIARILRIPGGTVRMRLSRGRAQLRKLMEEDEA